MEGSPEYGDACVAELGETMGDELEVAGHYGVLPGAGCEHVGYLESGVGAEGESGAVGCDGYEPVPADGY